MKNKNNNIFIDVDETLIRDCESHETADIIFEINNEKFAKKINLDLIQDIKQLSKNKFIIIWTSNSHGEEWAQKIVQELNLTEFVDLTLFKPIEIIDDSPLHEWFIKIKKPNRF